MAAESETSTSDTSTNGPAKGHHLSKLEEHTDRQCREQAALSLSSSFADDPVLRWLLQSRRKETSFAENDAVRDLFFRNGALSLHLAGGGGIVTNIDGDWKSVGLLVLPGYDPESFSTYVRTFHRLATVILRTGLSVAVKGMLTYPKHLQMLRHAVFPPSSLDPLVRHRLRDLSFYYLFFLGTNASVRGRGYGSAFMESLKEKARAHPHRDGKGTGVPIYFECGKDTSRLSYEKMGFKTVAMIRVGKGKADVEGRKKQGGEGVRLWALVWWPEGMWPEGAEYWDGKE